MPRSPLPNLVTCLGLVLGAGCESASPDGEGDVRVVITSDETIVDGLDTGPDEENTEDYAVRFDKYLAVVGDVELGRKKSGERVRLADSFVVNMKTSGSQGFALGTFEGLASGVWDAFGFRTPAADASTQRGSDVTREEHEEMQAGGYTYWIAGSVLRPAAEGGEVAFDLKLSVPTQFSECAFEGESGLAVTAGETNTATITLHGDHLFFNAFPAASEASVRRLARWVVDSDVNGDGSVDEAELAEIDATDLFTQARGYSLSGAPIVVETALDFARAQLASQGHFRGEGECAWELAE